MVNFYMTHGAFRSEIKKVLKLFAIMKELKFKKIENRNNQTTNST